MDQKQALAFLLGSEKAFVLLPGIWQYRNGGAEMALNLNPIELNDRIKKAEMLLNEAQDTLKGVQLQNVAEKLELLDRQLRLIEAALKGDLS